MSVAEASTEVPVIRAASATIRRARRRQRIKRNSIAYLFLAPNLVFFAIFLVTPVIWIVRHSFLTGGVFAPAQWAGLSNWHSATTDSVVRTAIGNTLLYTAMEVPAAVGLGLVGALLLRESGRAGGALRVILYVPILAPPLVAGLIWIYMLNPDFGLLDVAVRGLGAHPPSWLGSPNLALPTIAMIDTWRSIGFWAVLLVAALVSVGQELYDAARLDGARAGRRLWHVTLPAIRPTLVAALLIAVLFAMQVFDMPFILTQGGPLNRTLTAVMYIYNTVFASGNPGVGSVVSLVLLIVIVVVTVLLLWFLRMGSRSGRRR